MAGMKSIIITVVLVCLYIPHISQGFLCQVIDVKPGLKYDGTHKNIHGVHVGASQPFRCYDMYQDSRTELTCVGAYKWSDPSPPCILKACDPPISVHDGTVKIQRREEGDFAIYSCNEGYWYKGENPRICLKNNTWKGKDGKCEEVSCPSPNVPNNGKFNQPSPYKYKSRLKVICNTGFVYNGSQEMVCLTHNTWSGTQGQCLDKQLITCQELPVAVNVTVIPLRKQHMFNDTIHMSCPEGYIYNGTTRQTCQVDGSWSGQEGNCNIKTCPSYVPDGVGLVEPACSPCEYRDTVRVVCPQGYNYNGTELTCDQHGRWTGIKKNCTAIPCDDPVVAGGSVIGSGFVYQDEANIRCNPGYTWEGDYPQALCDSNGTWQIHGNCSVVMDLQSASGDGHKSTIAAAVCVPLVLVVLIIAGTIIYREYHRRKSIGKKKLDGDIEERIPLTGPLLNMNSDQEFIVKLTREKVNKNIPVAKGNPGPGTNKSVIKEAVLESGHVINRDPDKKIDLDTQFITLRLVGSHDAQRINDFLPDRYQDYLQKADGQNIEIEDLLNYIKEKIIPIEVTIDNDNQRSSREFPQLQKKTKNKKIGEVWQRIPLLLEGRGGVGKSTLVQKLMRLWAQNKWAKDYKAAFLFNIRSLTVVDKRPVSLVDFFKYFGVYILRDKSDSFTTASLKDEDKIIIFIDGIDEFAGLANRLNREENRFIKKKAEPLTWCLNILCRDVLGGSAVILASRPFKDLRAVHCDPVLEVVGLTRETILDFIDCHVGQDCEPEEKKAATIGRVKKAMTGNQLVMSVSAITYFCMLFCQVLEEDENISMEELTTYTRIAAFFVQNYLSRCPKDQFSGVQASSCLAPLASLAYNGLVTIRVNKDIARLVFDQNDLKTIGMKEPIVEIAGDCGILLEHRITQHREDQSEPETDFTYEFVHLSVQELLAMMELSQKDTDTLIKTSAMMWKSSSFNMAKMYLYGLHFDTESQNIKMLLQMMNLKVEKHENDESIENDRLIDIITMANSDKRAEVKSEDLLQIIQVTYETQNNELVKKVADRTFKQSTELKLSETLLTAIDMNAIIFMLKHIRNTNSLRLTEVTMNDTCVELLSGYLKVDTRITELSMEGTQLSTTSIRNIMESFGYQSHQKSLNLSRTGIYESSMSVLVDNLSKASCLTTLSLPKQNKDSALAVAAALSTNTSLHSISLQCDWRIYDNDETIPAVMKELRPNKTLQFMWLTGGRWTNTLVCEPGTGRQVRVEAGSLYTFIYAWTPADITPYILSHDGVVWGGDRLYLYLNDRFSSIYGEDHPVLSPDIWSQLLHDVTQCKHRVRWLLVILSSSSPLTPLLTSITSHWGALIHKQVEKVEVSYGEVTCYDLHTWYTSLITQPGWSVRGRYDKGGRADGAEITNTHGQSVVIELRYTRITSSHQDHRHSLEQAPALLYGPKWV